MKKPLNIFTLVKKAPQEATVPPETALSTAEGEFRRKSSWEMGSEEEEEDFNVSDKSNKNEDENYCTASEGKVNQAILPGQIALGD